MRSAQDALGAPAEERVSAHVSGRSIGTPLCWARPTSAEDVAAVIFAAREAGVRVAAIGAGTTFWDGLRVGDAVLIDGLALREPFTFDVDARVALVGAGRTVREVDLEARKHGLCVASRPDAAGDTPIASVLSVASTSGLGMGHGLAVEQIAGATVVDGQGRVVRFGTSHALLGSPYCAHGRPSLLGLVAGAQGRAAFIAEVGVMLRPAPFVTKLVHARAASVPEVGSLERLLKLAREALDSRVIDTFRVELGVPRGSRAGRLEVMARTFSDVSVDGARASAEHLGASLASLGYARQSHESETEDARRGVGPAYEFHWSFAPEQHRARLHGQAFWGGEITVSWGKPLHAALERVARLFDELEEVSPEHRRFAIYPGHHIVSIGVHVLVRPTKEVIMRTIAILQAAGVDLVCHGVPYRDGSLWSAIVYERLAAAGSGSAEALVAACLRAIDPDEVVGVPLLPSVAEAGS